MTTLIDETFLREPARSNLDVSPDYVPGDGEVLDSVYSVVAQVDALTVDLINGSPYPPAVIGDLVDAVTEIVDAVDPTTTITFDAAGAPGTTSQMRFTQTADRDYGFIDVGTNANVITLAGAQTVNGSKTFTETSFRVQSAGDPTITMAVDANGAPGTTATMTFNQAADRTYRLPDAPADAELLLVEGTQTINGTKLFTDLRVVDAVDNTIAMEFNANGAAATTGTLQFNQTANRVYTFPNIGTNADVVTLEGAQTITGNKSFPWTMRIFDAADPTTRLRIEPTTGTATSTIRFTQTANRVYTVPSAGVTAYIVITNATGTQTFSATKTFTAGIFTDTINERTLNHGTTVEGINFRTYTTAGSTVSHLTADGGAANIDLIFRGTSQVTAAVPNGAVSGGNVRGTNSTDLQRTRSNAARVAAGNASALLGGRNNRAAGAQSVVFSGSNNTTDGAGSCIASGNNCTAAGIDSFILSGESNQTGVAATNTFVMCGNNWNITGNDSFGGYTASALASFSGDRAVVLIADGGIVSADDAFVGACENITIAGISGAFAGCGTGHVTDGGSVLCGTNGTTDAVRCTIICGSTNSVTGSDVSTIGGGSSNVIDNTVSQAFITAAVNCTIDANSAETFLGGSEDATITNSTKGAVFSLGTPSSIQDCTSFFTAAGVAQIGPGATNGITTVGDATVTLGALDVFTFGTTTVSAPVVGIAIAADPGATLSGNNILLSALQYFIAADDTGSPVTLINAANDGAAAGAGVVVGEVYRTGSVLKVRVI